jgi:hypothetical protein
VRRRKAYAGADRHGLASKARVALDWQQLLKRFDKSKRLDNAPEAQHHPAQDQT